DQMGGRSEEEEMPMSSKKMLGRIGRPIRATIEWNSYTKHFEKTSREQLVTTLQNTLLQVKPAFSTAIINQYTDNSSKENFIKSATIQIMSTPEYQMC
ncbi:MAG: DUF1800 domain-containing protein, partial [Bacteroidota bacterium]|nr:DUF1800 domain-containing protein [Bacteroidota bacterium]